MIEVKKVRTIALNRKLTRMRALLVGLLDASVIGVDEWPLWLRIVITAGTVRPERSCVAVL
jgi:hypothetical protein